MNLHKHAYFNFFTNIFINYLARETSYQHFPNIDNIIAILTLSS